MSDSDSDSVHSEEYKPTVNTKIRKSGLQATRLCKVVNGEFLCKRCGDKFKTQTQAYSHFKKCKNKKKQMLNKCMWCGLEFTNRGNLASHAFHIHGDSSYKTITCVKNQDFTCQVCSKSYKTSTQLRYHIRSQHFNLQAIIPYAELKKVNQIWFEKVLNSNKIMEIRKTGHNTLIMRTLDENTGIKVVDVNRKVIDLSHIYPTEVNTRVNCEECGRSCLKRDYKKHIEEKHLNKKRHVCNNCNRTFKRSYLYLQHNCSKMRRVKGVHHSKDAANIRISSVESLSVPLG